MQEVVREAAPNAEHPWNGGRQREGDQAEDPNTVRLAELVRRDRDRETGHEPEVPASEPTAGFLADPWSGEPLPRRDRRAAHRTGPVVGSRTTIAVSTGRLPVRAPRSEPQPG